MEELETMAATLSQQPLNILQSRVFQGLSAKSTLLELNIAICVTCVGDQAFLIVAGTLQKIFMDTLVRNNVHVIGESNIPEGLLKLYLKSRWLKVFLLQGLLDA